MPLGRWPWPWPASGPSRAAGWWRSDAETDRSRRRCRRRSRRARPAARGAGPLLRQVEREQRSLRRLLPVRRLQRRADRRPRCGCPPAPAPRRRGGRDRAQRPRGRRPRGRAPHAGGPRRGGVLAAVSVGDGRDDLDARRHQRRRAVPVPPPAGRGAGIVRIGLVGAGAIAARHISVLATIPEVEIAGVCDRDLARANRLAETAGAPVFDSWTSMLDAAALDAVFVCTPPGAHAAVAAAVLERGTAAYVEKPLARTAEDGRTIVGAWQSSGAVCAVGYQWRSLDLLQQIRTLLGEAPPGMLVSRSIAATERARGDR